MRDTGWNMASYEACESEMERLMLHVLEKGFRRKEIFQQCEVGNYRLDFAVGGIAVEVDGKKYHDPRRDAQRDAWILWNSDTIHTIIRVEAAVLLYYPNACMGVLSHFMPDGKWHPSYARDNNVERRMEEAESWVDDVYHIGSEELRLSFAQGDAFEINGDVAYIGSPFAFLPFDHELWKFVAPKVSGRLLTWKGKITRKTF